VAISKLKCVSAIVGSILVLALIAVSCGKGTGDTTTAASSEKPQYGGTLNVLQGGNIAYFGAAVKNQGAGQDSWVLEQILGIDRAKGPAGNNEANYSDGPPSMQYVTGNLAESWSTPEVGVWKLKIRQGVHFALDTDFEAGRLVNGREMTAEDVAFSIEYLRDTPSSLASVAEPQLIKNMVVERTGPWELTIRTPQAAQTGYLWTMGGGGSQYVWPKEMLQKYGTSNEWRDQVGTGPYILIDWVDNSAATYKRNPNYWDKNPDGKGKGDELPYPDGCKIYIVPDISTRLANLRTGKADFISFGDLARDDAMELFKNNPNMKYIKTIMAPLQVGMRLDKTELPFNDKRVRQALMLATDQPGIKRDMYAGEAELLDSPARKIYPSIYTPLEQLPQSTQELYGYNPDKARQLLSDAGFPNGFKTKMVINSGISDIGETIKAQWAKVNVDVDLQVKEAGVYVTTWLNRSYDELLLADQCGGWGALFIRYSFGYFRGPNPWNISYVNDPVGSDPVIEKAFEDQSKVIMVNYPAADKVMKDTIPYILDQVFLIPMPAPYGYRVWQPWLKNYYGESATKFWLRYAWINQNLKKSMGF
jgi:peptide/nickel transport system substrate-binding protein